MHKPSGQCLAQSEHYKKDSNYVIVTEVLMKMHLRKKNKFNVPELDRV